MYCVITYLYVVVATSHCQVIRLVEVIAVQPHPPTTSKDRLDIFVCVCACVSLCVYMMYVNVCMHECMCVYMCVM